LQKQIKTANIMKTIKIQMKSVFGNELVYPVCDKSKILTALTRKKTLDNQDLEMIKNLGYKIMWV